MSLRIRRRAVLTGVLTGLAVVVPAVTAEVLLMPGANIQILLYMLLLAGLVLGGWRAGRRDGDAPLTHGAIAGLGAFFALELGVVIIGQLNDRPFPALPPIVFNTFMAACAGIFGGFLASLRPARTSPPASTDEGRLP